MAEKGVQSQLIGAAKRQCQKLKHTHNSYSLKAG